MAKKKATKKEETSKPKWDEVADFTPSSGEVGFDLDGLEESTVVSGATFWDFKTKPQFIGRFKKPLIADEDDPKMNRKKGDVFAYLMEDANGHEHLIGASYSIERAVTSENVGIGSIMKITFVEKKKSKRGFFNVFDVKLLKEKAK